MEPAERNILLNKKLTENQILDLLHELVKHSHMWDMVGISLGFAPSELQYIRSMPLLLASAPLSFFNELLRQWVNWPTLNHPTIPTLGAFITSLRSSIVGLGSQADVVENHCYLVDYRRSPTKSNNKKEVRDSRTGLYMHYQYYYNIYYYVLIMIYDAMKGVVMIIMLQLIIVQPCQGFIHAKTFGGK